jgi:hypothetical protein
MELTIEDPNLTGTISLGTQDDTSANIQSMVFNSHFLVPLLFAVCKKTTIVHMKYAQRTPASFASNASPTNPGGG